MRGGDGVGAKGKGLGRFLEGESFLMNRLKGERLGICCFSSSRVFGSPCLMRVARVLLSRLT